MLETLIMETGVLTDEVVEMSDNATPRQRHVQATGMDSNSDGDGDVEFAEPYKTPIALRRPKKKPTTAPVSESDSESEVVVIGQRKGNKEKGQVCSLSD